MVAVAPPHADDRRALKASLAAVYDVVEVEVQASGTPFRLLKVRDTNTLVDAITPHEFSDDERLPYWAELWPSSIVLAQSCLTLFALSCKRVLELGCGLGLAGIAAAKSGAFVTFSDYEHHALAFSRCNALTNLTPEQFTNAEFRHLDWRALPDIEPFDVIIAADCVYERRHFFPLIDVLNTLLKRNGIALFTEPGRSMGEQFFALLAAQGFIVDRSSHPAVAHEKTIEVVQAVIRHSG
jgi:predicted nicotinamide N-methyase